MQTLIRWGMVIRQWGDAIGLALLPIVLLGVLIGAFWLFVRGRR